MSRHRGPNGEGGKGPFVTEEQWKQVNRELWCIVRLADNTECNVYYVDGFEFRNFVDVGMAGGGNGFRDPYLHHNEIIVERMKNPHDEVAFLHHEISETTGYIHGKDYAAAHEAANESEADYRRETWQVPSPHRQD